MLEIYDLSPNEALFLDPSSNTIAIACCSGTISVYKGTGTNAIYMGQIIAGETYTIPAGNIIWYIQNPGTTNARVAIARFFVI